MDIGTNSVRLLVAEVGGAGGEMELRTVRREMRITRLGEGVDREGRLRPEAVERTVRVLEDYRRILEEEGAVRWLVAATSAVREAANAEAFLRRVEEVMGREPRVISGMEEAKLSFLGATYDLGSLRPRQGALLVVDIGGGSTEVILVDEDRNLFEARSLKMGCVRMSERFLESDPPGREELRRMESHVESLLEPLADALLCTAPALAVGLAGTVTTLAGLKLGLDAYEGETIHHCWLAREEVEDLYRRLAALPLRRRREYVRLEPGRADVIVGGAGVLAVFMRKCRLGRLLVSEKDILDGLVLSLGGER